MADCIYDQAFMSLRAGNGNIYETEYDVVEVSAAVKNPVLYELQSKAPKPRAVLCDRTFDSEECLVYGRKFHGAISRDDTSRLLGSVDGNYLIRSSSSQPGAFILSFMLSNRVRHYVLMYHNNEHYVGDNHYEDIDDLVADGLITLFMEENNALDHINKGPKLTRRPAVYSRRRSFHAHKLKIKYNSSLSDKTSSLVRSNAVKKVPINRRFSSGSSLNSDDDVPFENGMGNLTYEVAPESNGLGLPESMYKDVQCLDDSRQDVELSADQPCLTPISLHEDDLSKRNSSAVVFMYEKAHQFKIKTFGPPTWCDICNHFMWGIKSQGLRCQDCGINVHKQCAQYAEPDCIPTKNFVKRVYGIDLTTLLIMDGTKIPKVVRDCVHAVESRGLHTEGIYRISGSQDEVYAIKADFDSGLSLDLDEFSDIHSITGALKLFLRELPIPLITYKAFEQLLHLLDGRATETQVIEIIPEIKECFSTLPLSHYNLLLYLLMHLKRVSSRSSSNKMSERNLAVVFAPTVMRSPDVDVNSFKLIPKQQLLMETLIKHVDLLRN
jgi:hypothetical protein